MSRSIFAPGYYTTDLCKCGHHEGNHDWQNRCNICDPCVCFEQAPGISMLESAEEYAHEWLVRHVAEYMRTTGRSFFTDQPVLRPKGLRWIPVAQTVWNYRDHNCDYPGICTCTGGIPMMKPDCPRHGHLVRHSANRTG